MTYWGVIKKLGSSTTIPAGRFEQFMIMVLPPQDLLKRKVIGYVDYDIFWVICEESRGEFLRIPFARNRAWFDALTSEPEFVFISALPQMYII